MVKKREQPKKKTRRGKTLSNTVVMPHDGVDTTLTSKDAKGWKRVATAIKDRRAELGINQTELRKAAALSPQTLSLLEQGKKRSIGLRTAFVIEQALGWERGSLERLLFDGTEPQLAEEGVQGLREDTSLADEVVQLREEVAEIKESLDEILNFFKSFSK